MAAVPQPLAPGDEIVVDATGVSFAYGTTPVLEDVTFSVRKGEFAALVGPNGSGKSTLLRMLLVVLKPRSGTVRMLGEDPRELRDREARMVAVAERD